MRWRITHPGSHIDIGWANSPDPFFKTSAVDSAIPPRLDTLKTGRSAPALGVSLQALIWCVSCPGTQNV